MLKALEVQAQEEEIKRQQEWSKREQRIEQAMKRMGDNVIKKQEMHN